MSKAHILSGLDNLTTADGVLLDARVGLMTNPTGVDRELRGNIRLIGERYNLCALYAPEHGLQGAAQAGAPISTYVDPESKATVYSAYGASSRFTDEMLAAFDALVFDMQDVGARFYTYLYSLAYAMQACARAGKRIVVLDRINPIGGAMLGGTVLDTAFASFVGDYELPTRYALTIGEYARYVKDYLALDVDLTVVPLTGWTRDMYLDDTDLPWVAPSPNCPSLSAALCYPGTCVFEGSNVSEGRGTTLPFEVIGAPWIDGAALEGRMNALDVPGARYRRTYFKPTFSKYSDCDQPCGGVQLHVLDRAAFDSCLAGLLLMDVIREMYPERFEFIGRSANGIYTIDRLLGTDEYRAGGLSSVQLFDKHRPRVQAFARAAEKYRLY